MEIKNRKITVIGLGEKTGVSLVRYLVKGGAQVFVTEMKKREEVMKTWEMVSDLDAEFEFGGHSPRKVLGSTMAVLCPGVPIDSPFVKGIRESGIEVISELELAYRLLGRGKIISVTGTNGKSTTVTMIGEILRAWGKRVFVGGNLGNPLIGALEGGYDYYVVEVSSFQLEGTKSFRPAVGVLTNISENHLDRHRSMDVYSRLKLKMFTRQGSKDFAVMNLDDPNSRSIEPLIKSRKLFFSLQDGSADIFSDGSCVRGKIAGSGFKIDLAGFNLSGRHNVSNLMASAGAAACIGCPESAMDKALSGFVGLSHRIEFVAEVGGVKYYDDSKSTTVDSTLKAVESLGSKTVLIAGGRDKGVDYTPLKMPLAGLRAVILYGEAREKMGNALDGLAVYSYESFDDAVKKSRDLARDGDCVLLSPANTSFDQFADYKERGERFKRIVLGFKDGKRKNQNQI